MSSIEHLQETICCRYRVPYQRFDMQQILGISTNFSSGAIPFNGLRHPPEGATCGWYLWAGETLSTDPDFFQPIHAQHLLEVCPHIVPYLALPPGWRFLLADSYVDVWFDHTLLER